MDVAAFAHALRAPTAAAPAAARPSGLPRPLALIALALAVAVTALVMRAAFAGSPADAGALARARDAQTAVERYAAAHGGSYSGAAAALHGAPAMPAGVELISGAASYRIAVRSADGGAIVLARSLDGRTRQISLDPPLWPRSPARQASSRSSR